MAVKETKTDLHPLRYKHYLEIKGIYTHSSPELEAVPTIA